MPSFLSFYYLAAVSVGYYSGYVLLVFGKDVEFRWGQATGLLHLTNMALTTLFWVAAVVLPALLFYRNFSHIQDYNSPVVAQFGREMAGSLPAKPAIVLADDQARLYLAMGAARRLSLPDQYIFIESRELIHREYLRYLADRYPAFRKELKPPDSLPEEITTRQAADLLADLAKHGSVYYLHPSFGGYFEQIYMLPHRLGGYVCPYPTNGTGSCAGPVRRRYQPGLLARPGKGAAGLVAGICQDWPRWAAGEERRCRPHRRLLFANGGLLGRRIAGGCLGYQFYTPGKGSDAQRRGRSVHLGDSAQ